MDDAAGRGGTSDEPFRNRIPRRQAAVGKFLLRRTPRIAGARQIVAEPAAAGCDYIPRSAGTYNRRSLRLWRERRDLALSIPQFKAPSLIDREGMNLR
jgi:hypothetical protein